MESHVAILDSAGVLLEMVSCDDLVIETSEGWEVMVDVPEVADAPEPADAELPDWPDDPWLELGEAD